MPATRVLFYQDDDGQSPVVAWLTELRRTDRRGFANCVARIQQLADCGYELRRPAADYLRDGLHELRAKRGRVQHRLLYFFHGRNVAILAHAITKEDAAVPPIDIERALARKRAFAVAPARHTFEGEV